MEIPRPRGEIKIMNINDIQKPSGLQSENNGKQNLRYSKVAKPSSVSERNFGNSPNFSSQTKSGSQRSEGKRRISETEQVQRRTAGKIISLDDKGRESYPAQEARLKNFAPFNQVNSDIDGGDKAQKENFDVEKFRLKDRKSNSEKNVQENHQFVDLTIENDDDKDADYRKKKSEMDSKQTQIKQARCKDFRSNSYAFAEQRIPRKIETACTKNLHNAGVDELKMSESRIVKGSLKPLQSNPQSSSLPVKPLQSSLTNSSLPVSRLKKPVQLSRELKKPLQCGSSEDAKAPGDVLNPRSNVGVIKGEKGKGVIVSEGEGSIIKGEVSKDGEDHRRRVSSLKKDVVAKGQFNPGNIVMSKDYDIKPKNNAVSGSTIDGPKICLENDNKSQGKSEVVTKRSGKSGISVVQSPGMPAQNKLQDKQAAVNENKVQIGAKSGKIVDTPKDNVEQKQDLSSAIKAKEFKAYKYDERQEIKPRATGITNKGHVSKTSGSSQQRPKNRIIAKEGVIAKRSGPGKEAIDCNVQKKNSREQRARIEKFQEVNAEERNGNAEEEKGCNEVEDGLVSSQDSAEKRSGLKKTQSDVKTHEKPLQEEGADKIDTVFGHLQENNDCRKENTEKHSKLGFPKGNVSFKQVGVSRPSEVSDLGKTALFEKKELEPASNRAAGLNKNKHDDKSEVRNQLRFISSHSGNSAAVMKSFTDSMLAKPKTHASNNRDKPAFCEENHEENREVNEQSDSDIAGTRNRGNFYSKQDKSNTIVDKDNSWHCSPTKKFSTCFAEDNETSVKTVTNVISEPKAAIQAISDGDLRTCADKESSYVDSHYEGVTSFSYGSKSLDRVKVKGKHRVKFMFNDNDEPQQNDTISKSLSDPKMPVDVPDRLPPTNKALLKEKPAMKVAIDNKNDGNPKTRFIQNVGYCNSQYTTRPIKDGGYCVPENAGQNHNTVGTAYAENEEMKNSIPRGNFSTSKSHSSIKHYSQHHNSTDDFYNSKQHDSCPNARFQLEQAVYSQNKHHQSTLDSGAGLNISTAAGQKRDSTPSDLGFNSQVIEDNVKNEELSSQNGTNDNYGKALLVKPNMGCNHSSGLRPAVPPRNVSISSNGVQKDEKQLSPIVEDSGRENLFVNEEKSQRNAHGKREHSLISRKDKNEISPEKNSKFDIESAKSTKRKHEKSKPGSFIASLVKILQDNREASSENKTCTTEPFEFDKTVLVDTNFYEKSHTTLSYDQYPATFSSDKSHIASSYPSPDKIYVGCNTTSYTNVKQDVQVYPCQQSNATLLLGSQRFSGDSANCYDEQFKTSNGGNYIACNEQIQCDGSFNRQIAPDSMNFQMPESLSRPTEIPGDMSSFSQGNVSEDTTSQMRLTGQSDGATSQMQLLLSDPIPYDASFSQHTVREISSPQLPDPLSGAVKCIGTTISKDFITISSRKDKQYDASEDSRTRLSSFTATGRPKKVETKDGVEGNNLKNEGSEENQETGRKKEVQLMNESLRIQQTAEVEHNLKKLRELNALKNSIKLSQNSSAKLRKKFAKKKSKKSQALSRESGVNEVFYSAQDDSFADCEDLESEESFLNVAGRMKLGEDSEKSSEIKCTRLYTKEFDLPEVVLKNRIHCGKSAVQGLRSGSVGQAVHGFRSCGDAADKMIKEATQNIPQTPYYKSVVKGGKAGIHGNVEETEEVLEENFGILQTVRDHSDFGVKINGDNIKMPAKTKPSAKIKPYTVVDLATMSALSPEEVDDCLKEVTVAENLQWEKSEGNFPEDLNEEAPPVGLKLPPKSGRKRSNTAITLTNKEKEKLETASCTPKNEDSLEFTALKIVNMDYSKPGQLSEKRELNSFRGRAKTAPQGINEIQKAAEDARLAINSKKSPNQKASHGNRPVLVLENSIGPSSDHSGITLLSCNSIQSDINQSQDFPPPPSQEELAIDEKEIERNRSPDWPPLPESTATTENQTWCKSTTNQEGSGSKSYVPAMIPGTEKSKPVALEVIANVESHPQMKGTDLKLDKVKLIRSCDPHRSLPPIPGGQTPEVSSNGEPPLAWVSRATHFGTGPFIPMCQSNDENEDLTTSHFYDDIDQIRKVAQERAMMIKRLEEEEARLSPSEGPACGDQRNSLSEMPDLIPNENGALPFTETDEDCEFDRDDAKTNSKRWKKKNKKALIKSDPDLSSENHARSYTDAEVVAELPLTTTEKKNRSTFRKLLRKLSAPIKTGDRQDFLHRKATTPQLSRKVIHAGKSECDKTEIFATPATNRRLFSLSSKNQRQRTTSDTTAIKNTDDNETMAEAKRGKNRTGTISFGFGRKKTKKEARDAIIPSDDNRSTQSLEILKVNSDISSESGGSTRITPVASPILLNKDTLSKKYRAPNPPDALKALECSQLLRSDSDHEAKSSSENLARNRGRLSSEAAQIDSSNEKLPTHYEKVRDLAHQESIASLRSVGIAEDKGQSLDGRIATVDVHTVRPVKPTRNTADHGENQDDVFATEGSYDNYPPSKNQVQNPAKPPRSEGDDKEPGKKRAPEKPRRLSHDKEFGGKPEPYSSQRYRNFVGQNDGLEARLSPTLSNSEDESTDSNQEYHLPFDSVKSEYRKYRNAGIWESESVVSSASDYCLSANFQRGNKFYQSDRTMDRPTNRRRRGSLSNEHVTRQMEPQIIGDATHYENVGKTSPIERDDIFKYSVDSYDKLLEIHRDTVRQIAEATVFKCNCTELKNTDWNDFEICGKLLNYGLSSYVTVPVAVKKDGAKSGQKFTAWLRQSLGFLQMPEAEPLTSSIQELTRHENLLHICQDIQRSRDDDKGSSDEVPQDIHVSRMLVSRCTPKMGLSKYLALTMDKHARDPETYEKEACLILLQILKGLGHLASCDVMVENIDCESVLLTDVQRGVLSANFGNNNNKEEVLGCPIAMYVALPGLLKCANKGTSKDDEDLTDEDKNSNGADEVKRSKDIQESDVNSSYVSAVKGDVENSEVTNGSKDTKDCKDVEISCKFQENQQANATTINVSENDDKTQTRIDTSLCREIVSLIFEIFHASHLLSDDFTNDEIHTTPIETPRLPVKSQYSQRLQSVIETLSAPDNNPISLNDLIKQFQVIAFCPVIMGHVDKEELLLLLDKWRNRRCVDMVSDILKKYSLISLASGLASGGTNSMGLARNCVLECQFLASASAEEISNIISFMGCY